MKKVIIFIGPPGSGKGTQSKLIAAKFGYGHISTGDLLRQLQREPTLADDESEALENMKKGQLVPDWLIYRLAFRASEDYLKKGPGVVFDGAIRNVAQAEKYQEFFNEQSLLDQVVVLEVALPDEVSFKRLAWRRICKQCGAIIPLYVDGAEQKVCPTCGGEMMIRHDDQEEIVHKRIKEQGNAAIKPVREFYAQLHLLRTIDGLKTVQQVEKDIENVIISLT